jgi:uncharacterized protein (UPF0548 family)
MRFVRPNDVRSVGRLLEALGSADPTYADTGATLAGRSPSGFRLDRYNAVLGRGQHTFDRAVLGLQSWRTHRSTGMRVLPEDAEVRPGLTVVVAVGTPWLALAVPCRIVGVIDEPGRWGFAYGTLPGHPENGEEAFVVSIADDQSVRFDVTAFSRPASPVVRLSGPLGRAMQRRGSTGYLRALERFVDHAG